MGISFHLISFNFFIFPSIINYIYLFIFFPYTRVKFASERAKLIYIFLSYSFSPRRMGKHRNKRRKSEKISRRKTRFSAPIDKKNIGGDYISISIPISLELEDAPEALQRFFTAFGDAEWGTNLGASDVLAVLKNGGKLSARALSELSCVRMGTAHGELMHSNAIIVEINSNEDARLFENILDALGPDNLRYVALDYEVLRTYGVNRLEERCSGVESVVITDTLSEFDLSKLLQHCGANLRVLDIQGKRLRKSHINAIEKFCTAKNLRHLRIDYKEWEPSLFTWDNIGESLEVLSITCPIDFLENRSSQSETLTAILRNCSKLSHIEIQYPFYEDFSFPVAFCTLLGERLLSLKLKTCGTFLPHDDACKIFEACRNTTIDGDVWVNNNSNNNNNSRAIRLEKASCLPIV